MSDAHAEFHTEHPGIRQWVSPHIRMSDSHAAIHRLVPEDCQLKGGCRGSLARLLLKQWFDTVMGCIIVANVCVMVYETNSNAPCVENSADDCNTPSLWIINYIFLAIYSVEAAARLYVFRLRAFYSMWNILDFFIVAVGFVDVLMGQINTDGMPGPSMSLLRIFRVFRLLRTIRVFNKIPELRDMLRGFLSAMRSMAWGFLMIQVLLLLFSILCVELVHPVSVRIHVENEVCKEAFGNVWFCMLMFFQGLVAGDSWGLCTIPIIKEEWWTFVVFAGALLCVQLGFMNLILAVIVENAARAKDEDEEDKRNQKIKTERKATFKLEKLFKAIDSDGSGSISKEELMTGFDSNTEMQNMFSSLDMSRTDVEMLFDLLDTENEYELSYEYLIQNIRLSLSGDFRKSFTILRLQTAEVVRCSKMIHENLMNKEPSSQAIQAKRPKSRHLSNKFLVKNSWIATATAAAGDDAEHSAAAGIGVSMGGTRSENMGPCHSEASASPIRTGSYWEESDCFKKEFGAQQMWLDSELCRIRSSIDKLAESLSPCGAAPSKVDLNSLRNDSRPPCNGEPLVSGISGDGQSLRQGLDLLRKDSRPDLRLAAILADRTLKVEKGSREGDVSL